MAEQQCTPHQTNSTNKSVAPDQAALEALGIKVDDKESYTIYTGSRQALLAAGLIRPEWIVGLGKYSRAFLPDPYEIVLEGTKGNYVTHERRRRGLMSVLPLRNGDLILRKYRSKEEESARLDDQWRAVAEQLRNAKRTLQQRPRSASEELARRYAANSACLDVGTMVLYFDQANGRGKRAVIIEEYGAYNVADLTGPHVDNDGVRYRCCYGYVIQVEGERDGFVPAHSITLEDCKPAHMRLVGGPTP